MNELPIIEIRSGGLRDPNETYEDPLQSLGAAVAFEVKPVATTIQDENKKSAADDHFREDFLRRQRSGLLKAIVAHPTVYSGLQPDVIGGDHVKLLTSQSYVAGADASDRPQVQFEEDLPAKGPVSRLAYSFLTSPELIEIENDFDDYVTRDVPELGLKNVVMPFSMSESSTRYQPKNVGVFVDTDNFKAETVRIHRIPVVARSNDKVNQFRRYVNRLTQFLAG